MITIQKFLETINYRITEGSEYLWKSFGDNAFRLDSWDGEQEGVSCGMIFDTQTQVVYQTEVHDYANRRSYRWTHPEYVDAYKKETIARLSKDHRDVAYDDVKYIDLDVSEDFLKKARSIVLREPYDTRVSVPIDLDDAELFLLMKRAHDMDITLNQLIEKILSEVIQKTEQRVDNEIK